MHQQTGGTKAKELGRQRKPRTHQEDRQCTEPVLKLMNISTIDAKLWAGIVIHKCLQVSGEFKL